MGMPDAFLARRGDPALGDDEGIGLHLAEGRFGIVDGEPDQLLAGGQRRLVHGAGHQIGQLRSAGDGRARKRGIAQLHRHAIDGNADRIGRGLGQDRIGAGPHVDAAAGDLHRAIPEDAHQRLAGRAADGIGAGGEPIADELAALAHRPRRGLALRPAEGLRPLREGLAEAAGGPGLVGAGILLGIVQQADLQRIDPDLIGQLVHGAFDAEGARDSRRAPARRRAAPYSPARCSGAS